MMYPFTTTVVLRYFVNVNETQSITENVTQETTTIEYEPVIVDYGCDDDEVDYRMTRDYRK
tara:strand:- start:7019 stop:7201 length:183 start_codon:yes stop_codon:yes gene_type:complete